MWASQLSFDRATNPRCEEQTGQLLHAVGVQPDLAQTARSRADRWRSSHSCLEKKVQQAEVRFFFGSSGRSGIDFSCLGSLGRRYPPTGCTWLRPWAGDLVDVSFRCTADSGQALKPQWAEVLLGRQTTLACAGKARGGIRLLQAMFLCRPCGREELCREASWTSPGLLCRWSSCFWLELGLGSKSGHTCFTPSRRSGLTTLAVSGLLLVLMPSYAIHRVVWD